MYKHRHFLVKEEDGDYQLREIEPGIANGISLFGIITGQCYTVESVYWTFYFMNCHVSPERADKIAKDLTEQFLASDRYHS